MLGSQAEDSHQMYFGGSILGKASTIGIGISPRPPLIFAGIKKCEIWRHLKHHSTLSCSCLKMQQDIRILNKIAMLRLLPIALPSLVKLGPRTPENAVSFVTHPLKFNGIFG